MFVVNNTVKRLLFLGYKFCPNIKGFKWNPTFIDGLSMSYKINYILNHVYGCRWWQSQLKYFDHSFHRLYDSLLWNTAAPYNCTSWNKVLYKKWKFMLGCSERTCVVSHFKTNLKQKSVVGNYSCLASLIFWQVPTSK